MITTLRNRTRPHTLVVWLVALLVLLAAAYLGQRPSRLWVGLLAAGIGGAALLALPVLGLPALVLAALVAPIEFNTGTEVKLNAATLLVPALLAVWLLLMVRRRHITLARSAANRPLAALPGRRPALPPHRPCHLGSPGADGRQLPAGAACPVGHLRLLRAGLLAGRQPDHRTRAGCGGSPPSSCWSAAGWRSCGTPRPGQVHEPLHHHRLHPCALLGAVDRGGRGAALFNRALSCPWRVFLLLVLGASLVYAFVAQQEAASNWVGLAAVLGTLIWLRFPRLRWPIIIVLVVLLALGVLVPSIYQFAGGDAEWALSGGSRLALGRARDRGDPAQPDHRAGSGRLSALRRHETVAVSERAIG